MSDEVAIHESEAVQTKLAKVEKKAGRPRFEAGLHPRNRTIARLVASGMTYTQVAKTMDTSVSSISRMMKAPLMKAEVGRLQGNLDDAVTVAQQRTLSLLDRAMDVIEEDLGNPEEGIQPMSPDRDHLAKTAWKVYDAVLGKNSSGKGGVNVNLQINQQTVMADLKEKSEEELTKGVIDIIEAKKKEER